MKVIDCTHGAVEGNRESGVGPWAKFPTDAKRVRLLRCCGRPRLKEASGAICKGWSGVDRPNSAAKGTEGADEATVKKLNAAVDEASRNARQAGYTPAGIARIISTPSDVAMFSRLPEADQKAILHQASDAEFERYRHSCADET
jgi:hypothetical protein